MTPELGFMDRVWTEAVGRTEVGRYNLRWGFPGERNQELVLDTDFYSEDVNTTDLSKLLLLLHDQSFALFRWCLDEQAINFMNGDE